MTATFKTYNILGGSCTCRELSPSERESLKVTRVGIGWGSSETDPGAPEEVQVQTALAFLHEFAVPLKHSRRHSYGLKHTIEAWGEDVGREPYVSNGAAIEAVRRLGWPIAIGDDSSPNALLGLRILKPSAAKVRSTLNAIRVGGR
jgi:hypothetical protein